MQDFPILQYQRLAEPVFTGPAPPLVSSWFRQASIPVWLKPVVTATGLWSGVLEPSLFVPQDLSWLRQTETPVWVAPRPVDTGQSVEPLEPSLFVPQKLDWFRQTSEPVRLAPRPVDAGYYVGPLEPSLVVPQNLAWLRVTENPIWLKPRPVDAGYSIEPLEPSLFVPQNLDWLRQAATPVWTKPEPLNAPSWFGQFAEQGVAAPLPDFAWFQQASEPVWVAPRAVGTGFWSGVLEPSLFVAQKLDWFVQASEPIRVRAVAPHGPFFFDVPREIAAIVWTNRGLIQLFSITGLPASQTYWFEIDLQATAGTVRGRLMNKTTAVAVTGSEVSTAAAVKTRVRSAGGVTLADGAEYETQTGKGASDTGNWWGSQALPVV